MGGASSVLTALALVGRRRAAVLAVDLAGLVAYAAVVGSLAAVSTWTAVAILACALLPATFLLVWCVLPLAGERPFLLGAGAAGAVFAAILHAVGAGGAAGLFKLAALTALGFWLLAYFERLSLVVIVALLVPWVDAYSVWRGPTHTIVTKHEHVFAAFSLAFPLPGGAVANLGLPDLLFFAIFLGAAAKFSLRPGWTWLGMVACLGATVALTVWLDLAGLPALPGLALGFLVPNADLIWRELRGGGRP